MNSRKSLQATKPLFPRRLRIDLKPLGKGKIVTDQPQKTLSGPKLQRHFYIDTLADIYSNRTHDNVYLINSIPKSASTYTMGIVKDAVNGTLEYGGDLEIEVEQSFSISGIQRTTRQTGNIVYKLHSLPNFLNVQAIKQLDMKYINIGRNLFDAMVSIDEHLLRGVNPNNVTLWPGLRIKNYNFWENEKRYDFISDFIMPWYFQYFSAWASVDKDSILFYEEMVQDPEAYFGKVAARMGLAPEQLEFNHVGTKRNARFNVGKIGRGDILRDTYLKKFRRYAEYYPGYDYHLIGL